MADKKAILAIKVRFQLNTKDGLRRVNFTLVKDVQGKKVIWTIGFQLFEREKKTDEFKDPLIDISVEISKELHEAAEEAATSRRLTTGQKTHALGPAADAQKAAADGELDQEVADQIVEDTLD